MWSVVVSKNVQLLFMSETGEDIVPLQVQIKYLHATHWYLLIYFFCDTDEIYGAFYSINRM